MTNAKVFLVGNEPNQLTAMTEAAYDTEAVLQTLLVNYPDLLPGDQINPDNPRLWLLVAAEMGVPGGEAETGRWSLDHLFLDQDAVPTFVECKRATDTRIRREVVAQMLDYAANGIEYWTIDRIREAAANTAHRHNRELNKVVAQLIDAEVDDTQEIEAFWQTVEENLNKGRVRLLFVADAIPKELRQLVEFLNKKMSDVEVLAVEIKQFKAEDEQRVIVPRVIGQTSDTIKTPREQTNREKFLAACSPAGAEFFESVLKHAIDKGHTIYWGTKGFSVRALLSRQQSLVSFVYGWPSNRFDFYFGYLPISEAEAAELRQELLTFEVFKESGQKTLTSPVEESTLPKLRQVYEFILTQMDDIIRRY